MSVAYPLRIYYDRQCPLCARELHALKRYDLRQQIELVDCSGQDFDDRAASEAGINATELMGFIHARAADGRWLKGVQVFEAAYAAAGLDGVARMFAHPLLRPVWNTLYPHVARHRMGLSRLGLDRPFGWLVTRAARRAAEQAESCSLGRCKQP